MRKGKARAARLAATQVDTPDVCGLSHVQPSSFILQFFFLIIRLPNKFSKCHLCVVCCRPLVVWLRSCSRTEPSGMQRHSTRPRWRA